MPAQTGALDRATRTPISPRPPGRGRPESRTCVRITSRSLRGAPPSRSPPLRDPNWTNRAVEHRAMQSRRPRPPPADSGARPFVFGLAAWIPAFAGMTEQRLRADAVSDYHSREWQEADRRRVHDTTFLPERVVDSITPMPATRCGRTRTLLVYAPSVIIFCDAQRRDSPSRIMARSRPLSPHLQVYRLPLLALMSISHRATGGGARRPEAWCSSYWLAAVAERPGRLRAARRRCSARSRDGHRAVRS